ncbi:MAG: phage tail protein [Xanthobacteraceae bacterium]
MAQTSFAVMTTVGRAKEAAALANATAITVTNIAIGDGATVPSGGETALYHEVARKTISGHGTVVGASNVAYFDCYLSAAEGPYTIREAGLYDEDGDLIAIAHYDPPINKPVPESGQTVEGTVRLEVAFSDVASVVIKIDPSMQVALQRLTRLPWISVISMSLAAPPASPAVGDTYLIAAAPTGGWTGNAGKIAEYTIAGWAMMTPSAGHGISLPDGRVFEYVGGAYVEKLALDAQSGKWQFAVAGGTANALTATLAPVPAGLVAGMRARLKAGAANTGAMTLNVNGLGAKAIVRKDGAALAANSVVAGQILDVVYDGAVWQALDVVGGSGAYAIGKIVGITASGTYTPSPGCRALLVELVGGGGGGGASGVVGSGQLGMGDGGAGGGYARKLITDVAASYACTIGAGGAPAETSGQAESGGTTSFGTELSATGGWGGNNVAPGSNPNAGAYWFGGVGIGGDVVYQGGSGTPGLRFSSINSVAGAGGDSTFGRGGGGSGATNVVGFDGTGYGSGGGGGLLVGAGSGVRGGYGKAGVIFVQELF